MKRKLLFVPILLGLSLASCGGSSEPTSNAKEVFCAARKNTSEATQYQYNFNLSAKIKFGSAVSYSPANYSGTTYVNMNNENTQFLQKRELSGLLLFDSTSYIYNVGNDLVKVNADEDKDFSVVNQEKVSLPYDFDRFNFGYILKELNEDGLLKVTKSNNKYNLALKTNFSQDSLLGMLNFLDSNIILKALNSYTKQQWGVGLSVNTWATIDEPNSRLSKFHFDASVVIKNVFSIGFEFEQTFTKYSGVSITLPTFSNTYLEEAQVKSQITSVKTSFNNAKSASTSYYTYKTKTTVDHGVSLSNPLGLAVNSTTQGNARRQILDNVVYFNNKLEVDSDYKNNDQYGELVKDYNSYRARLNNSNKDVYNVLDPTVGFNQYTLLDNYHNDDVDNYYMLPAESLLDFENLKVVKVTTDNNNNKKYKFGLTTDAVKALLKHYNKHIRIDYNEVTVFDIYDIKEGFKGSKASLVYITNSEGKLQSIEIDLKGFYIDKKTDKQIKYRLEVDIDYDWTKSYSAVTRKEDIDNK